MKKLNLLVIATLILAGASLLMPSNAMAAKVKKHGHGPKKPVASPSPKA